MSFNFLVNTKLNLENYNDIFNKVKGVSLDFFVALSPSINYLFQARKFKKTKSSKDFSHYLCLITLLSHSLKVLFWLGKRFKYTLLIQSILVIIVQLYLIFLCIKFKGEVNKTLSDSNNKAITTQNNMFSKIKKFIYDNFLNWSKTVNKKLIWKWTSVNEYYKFYFLVIMLLSIFTYAIGIKNKYFIDIIGTVSIIIDMASSLPQVIEMHKSKNPKNISKIMVLLWINGNCVKIYYNVINKSPIQLIIGSCIQVFFNIILLFQIIYYYIKNLKQAIISPHTRKKVIVGVKSEKKKEVIELTEDKKEEV